MAVSLVKAAPAAWARSHDDGGTFEVATRTDWWAGSVIRTDATTWERFGWAGTGSSVKWSRLGTYPRLIDAVRACIAPGSGQVVYGVDDDACRDPQDFAPDEDMHPSRAGR